jgi:hypothetical protein
MVRAKAQAKHERLPAIPLPNVANFGHKKSAPKDASFKIIMNGFLIFERCRQCLATPYSSSA